MKDYCKYIDDSRMMRFHPVLADIYGLNEAIFIQQLHYWLNRKPHYVEERGWVYNSYESWHTQLPFWSIKTIQRIVKNLIEKNIIEVSNFNKLGYDRTLWYTLNYDLIDEQINAYEATNKPFGQNDQIDSDNLTKCHLDNLTKPIPSINTSIKKVRKTNYDEIIDKLIIYDEVKEAVRGFIQMRAMKKKPLTDRALTIQLNKLNRYAPNNKELQIEIVDKSTVKAWDEFYEIKDYSPKQESRYADATDILTQEQIDRYKNI